MRYKRRTSPPTTFDVDTPTGAELPVLLPPKDNSVQRPRDRSNQSVFVSYFEQNIMRIGSFITAQSEIPIISCSMTDQHLCYIRLEKRTHDILIGRHPQREILHLLRKTFFDEPLWQELYPDYSNDGEQSHEK